MNELEIEEVLKEYSKAGQGYNIPLAAECLESYTDGRTIIKLGVTRSMDSLPDRKVCDAIRLNDWIRYGRLIGVALPCDSGWMLYARKESVLIAQTHNGTHFFELEVYPEGIAFRELFLDNRILDREQFAEPTTTTPLDDVAFNTTQQYFDSHLLKIAPSKYDNRKLN